MNVREITHAYGSQLDQGRTRANNQDSLATAKIQQTTEDKSHSIGIYIIADGVGGAPHGDVASKLAVDMTIRDMVVNTDLMVEQGNHTDQMKQSVRLAHETILRQFQDEPRLPATTLVMAMVIETNVYFLNIGDSRAYVLSGNNLRQITVDHTYAQALVDAGHLTVEEARNHPFSSKLSQYMGGSDEFEPDVFTENLKAGDYVLLCSDGLYNFVPEHKIIGILRSSLSPQEATDRLTEAANNAGGGDNIAVIVVEIMERAS